MEKNRKRALRRFHNARMLKRAQVMILEWYCFDKPPNPEELHQDACRRRDNMQVCSCSGCGNPRHSDWSGNRERLTMPERKAEDSYFDALEDYLTVDPIDIEE